MSVLTRIKNNQITDSTILANTKIAPGSIVGSLFNANLTMTSDVTITGNLTVQGSSTYLTVASTNTYVNDPLIVMNNAFTGTNTNDIGLLFNRGSDTNQAFIWDESEDEFRLIATTETGDTYGAVLTSSFANLRIGNLTVEESAAFGSISTTGNISAVNATLSGDLAVDGGDITTTATTFNLLTANTATVNAFTVATTLELGAETGTLTLNNPTVVGSSTTANLWNTTTTTVNTFGAATAINLGATTGTLTINNPTVVGSSATQDLYNTTATTLNFAGAATILNIGASTGTVAINNATIDLNGNVNINKNVDSTSTTSGALTVDGGIGIAGNIHAANVYATNLSGELLTASQPNITSVGELTSLSVAGNVNAGNVSGTNLVGTTLTGTLLTNAQPNITSVGELTTLTVAGNVTAGNVSATIVSATNIESTNLSGTLLTNAQPNITSVGELTSLTVAGNVTAGNLISNAGIAGATLSVTGNTSLGLTTAAAINNTPIGNITPSTGSFTTLLSSGVTQVTNTSTATGIGTGAFRVDGGASVSGNLWVGGNINIVGNTFTISGNAGQFFGDDNGFGALYAGVTGFTFLPRTVLQSAADINDYAQNNFENVNTGAQASTDWVATAGAGDDFSHYINMGITSGNWDGTQENSLTDAVKPHDGYMYVQGNITVPGSGGNLVIGAATADHYVKVVAGGNTAAYTVAVFDAPGTPSTNTTTGALTVIGGVGVFGNIHANNLSTGGEISADDLTLAGNLAVNGGDITTTATTFNLLDATATTVNAFGDATSIDLGATTGTLTINNPTIVGTSTTQDVYNTVATTVNAFGAATTLNLGADTGTATINNDTINLEGNVNVNKTTASTSYTTGALVVDGGVGIAGNLNVGENLVVIGNLTVQGNSITLTTDDLTVTDASITLASGAPDGAAADGGGIILDGANATILYNHATTSWDLNKITRVLDDTDTISETTGAFRVAGGVAIAKDLFVGGGDIITDETTFNLLNTTATTLNVGGAASTLNIGATTGTLTINNPTVVGTQTTQDLYNTTATTLNFAGAATTLTIGATTGTTTIRNALVDIDGNATVGGTLSVTGNTSITGNLTAANTSVGSLTAVAPSTIGNIRFESRSPLWDGVIYTPNVSHNLLIESYNTLGLWSSGNVQIQPGNGQYVIFAAGMLPGIARFDIDVISSRTTQSTSTTTGALVLAGGAGVAGNLNVGESVAVNGGDLTTTATTFNLLDATATTVNAFGSATAIDLGATTGTLTINNPTVVGTQTTQNLYNTIATTVNAFGAASTLVLGDTTGTANIRNATTNIIGNATVGGTLDVTGAVTFTDDIAVNGGDITTTATSASVFNTNATGLNIGGAATTINLGATFGTLTINNPSVTGSQATQDLYATSETQTMNFATKATSVNIGGTSGTISLQNANIWLPNAVTIDGAQATVNLLGNATTVDAFKSATDLEFGATTGTLTINNPTVVGTQTSQDLYNTTATTVNFAGAATALVAGATSGTFSLRNANLHLPNATTIHSSQATVAVLNENVTTVNGFGDATALTLGATTGTATVRNATVSLPNATNIHVSQSSITFANTNATTVDAFGAATELNFASASGNTIVRNNLISSGILVAVSGIDTTELTNNPADGTTSFFVLGGSVLQGNVFITEEANISYANVYANKISTSSTTGALTVSGGVGLGANLNVSSGAVINIDQTAQPFQVKGQFATTLIYADSITDTVTIGGSNTTPVSGATLRVNGTGAMILPVGTTSQRPGTSGNVDVSGMLRLNSSLNILEYYDGTAWQSSQGSFTVINSESFNGDGDTLAFTLSGAGSTASTIVAINGIVQIPITSYSVSDTTLTFTEAPEIGDVIDVRRLTTTASVDELGFGQNIFKANLDYAYIATGSVTSTPRLLIDTAGLVTVTGNMEIYGNLTVKGDTAGQINIGDTDTDNVAITAEINSNLVPNENNLYDLGKPTQRWKTVYSHETVHDQTPISVTANATPILIDSFLTSEYSSAKYLVQIKDGSAIQAAELLLVQDTTDAFITTYGILSNNGELGTFTANVAGGNVNIYYTSTSATNSGVKLHPTYIV